MHEVSLAQQADKALRASARGGRVLEREAEHRNATEDVTEGDESGHVESAIGMHDLACDEAGAVRGEKDNDVGDVRGLGHSTKRDKPRLLQHLGLAELIAWLCRVGETGGDSVDANTMGGECQRHGAGEADNDSLA